jgi:hypothetical protein
MAHTHIENNLLQIVKERTAPLLSHFQ